MFENKIDNWLNYEGLMVAWPFLDCIDKILLWQEPESIQVFIHGAKQVTDAMPLYPARRGKEI